MKIDHSQQGNEPKRAPLAALDRPERDTGRAHLSAEVSEAVSSLQKFANLQSEVAVQQLSRPAALAKIAEQMLLFTGATGAAIALLHDENLVCKASVGEAPPVGTVVPVDGSLSGECFRTGSLVSCEDTRSDQRFSREVRDQLPFRSLLILPITDTERKTVGLLEVLSPDAEQFDAGDVLILGFVADLIATLTDNSLSSL